MIGQKLRPVSQKMWQFHLNMNIEGTLWRHAVTSLVTSSLWKSFWWMIYILSFYTCCQIEAILKTAKFFKLTKIWGPGELFHHKCHQKNTENTRWKHHHRNFNGSAQYVDTATTLLPCNRAPATNGQSTNMTSQTHVNVSTKHADTTAVQHRQHHGNTAVIPRSFKMNNVEYICTKCFENFATEDEYIPLGEQSPCRLRDGNAISVEWISSSALNTLSIALLSTPTL